MQFLLSVDFSEKVPASQRRNLNDNLRQPKCLLPRPDEELIKNHHGNGLYRSTNNSVDEKVNQTDPINSSSSEICEDSHLHPWPQFAAQQVVNGRIQGAFFFFLVFLLCERLS